MNNLALTESKSLRDENISKVEVLEKVKAIEYMTDDMIVSVEQAVNYYEVDKRTIERQISQNYEELKTDGLKILKGEELKNFKATVTNVGTLKYASQFTIIPRRALLRIGMLLRDSEVAAEVRTMLLNKEESAPNENAIVSKVDAATKIAPGFIALGQTFGMSEQLARTYAVKEMKKYIPEIDYAPLLQGNVIEGNLFSPTELGEKFGLTAVKFNRILKKLDYQYKEGKKWYATEKGELFSDVIPQEGNGTRLSLRWKKDILKQEDVMNAIKEMKFRESYSSK